MWSQPSSPNLPCWVDQSRSLCERNQRLLQETGVRIAIGWRVRNGWQGLRGGSDRPMSTHPGSPLWPVHELEGLVREKLRRGALFVLEDVRFWASPAGGNRCLVCSQPIIEGNDLEVRAPRGYVHTHVFCHRIWLEESNARRSSARSAGTSDM